MDDMLRAGAVGKGLGVAAVLNPVLPNTEIIEL